MIEKALNERILVLDGAMGTMQQRGYSTREVHDLYLAAGADIIETATFNLEGYDFTYTVAKIAREAVDACGREAYVAGVLGPFSKMLSLSDDAFRPEYRSVSFNDLCDIYTENASALLDAGCDLIMVETVFDPINAKAALYALESLFEERGRRVPVMVSATINDREGRLLNGATLESLYCSLNHFPLLSFGINCSFGAKDIAPAVMSLDGFVRCAVSLHPNAGLPNHMGEYEEKPEDTAAIIRDLALGGYINIAGGCCGTTPDHIRAIKNAVEGIPPRKWKESEVKVLEVAGLETVKVDLKTQNFVNVGERTNVAGSRKFARLIAEKNYSEAASIARRQVEDGASIIDINMDDAMLDSAREMEDFIRYISNDPSIVKAAIMIDSSDWNTIVAGLRNVPGRAIVNSISLKEGEEEFLRKAREIRKFGAAVIVMAFDEKGQAVTFDRKCEIVARSYKLLTEKAGFRPEDIVFDVNVLTVGTGVGTDAKYAVDFIEAVRWIKAELPGCHTSGGVSNLSFAFRGNNPVREAMHSIFLYHAVKAGLDMAIVNPSMLKPYDQIDPELLKAAEDVILNKSPEATMALVDVAQKVKMQGEGENAVKQQPWRELPVEERLTASLRYGIEDWLEEDINETLKNMSAIDIIEKVLLGGMDEVGKLFSEGKMFLPQVVKSAKTMRTAVDILQPYLDASSGNFSGTRKKIILATVQGDVHDIGKNILGIVLSCNNLEVIDLGVMVENTTILEAIRKYDADFVGVSGLITPSLAMMESLCRKMEKAGCTIPLFVGGATTTALHTALKLAPQYSRCVAYTGSASDCSSMVSRMVSDLEGTIASVKESQQQLVKLHAESKEKFLPLEEARKRAVRFIASSFVQPEKFGHSDILEKWIDPSRLAQFIDWRMFLSFWGFKTKESIASKEAEECLANGKKILSTLKDIEIDVQARFFDATAVDETIIIDSHKFNTHRSTSDRTDFRSLADFVPSAGRTSKVGLFAVKVEDHHKCCDCRDYDHLMRESLCERLAEAAGEWLQAKVSCGSNVIRPAFGYSSCPDHTLKREAFDVLGTEEILGLKLTESCAMVPETSLCGMIISHPNASFFTLREKE